MMPVSEMTANRAQQPPAAAEVKSAPPKEEPRTAPQKPVLDEYVPEEKREPSGRYWLERDEDGKPEIRFDGPAQPRDAPDAGAPEKSGSKTESVRGSTDKVDREIEKLKKARENLERQIRLADSETKRRELERKLAQVENELRQKDNDAYRRQHMEIS